MRVKDTAGHRLLWLPIALVLAITMFTARTQAQIVGDLEADIPFQFHAGNAKFPPGQYMIHFLDSSDLNVMEISSADGSISAVFEVHEAEANTSPAKSELIFNKYGSRYFLAKLFDEGNPSGSQVLKSRYEERVGQAVAEAQEHVPCRNRARVQSRGN